MSARAFTLAALVVVALLPRVAAAQTLEDYTVVTGDTCASIAERFYGSPRRYDRIHAHNPDLGPEPHHLSPGMVLHLPLPYESGADATVTDARGSVRRQLPTDSDWDGAHIGDELRTGARVSTGERSSAELTFRSSTVAAIRAETLVIVHGASVESVREEGSHAILREGSLLGRLSSLSGGAPLLVETPTAEVAIGAGETSVHVQAGGDTAVSAHTGAGATVRTGGDASGDVSVPAGSGTSVRRGGRPTPPRPLPAAPTWSAGDRVFLGRFASGDSTGGGTLSGGWLPVAAAARYHVEIARREDGRDVVFQTDVPATVTRFEAYGLPPGRYYVRIATYDAEWLEGRPAAGEPFEIVGVRFLGPGEAAPPPSTGVDLLEELDALSDAAFLVTEAPRAPQLLVGTRALVPDGVVCAIGASAPAHELVLTEPGEAYLTCVSAEGTTIVGMNVEVVRLRAEVRDTSGALVALLPRDASTEVLVAIDAIDLPPSAVVMTATGADATPPIVEPDGTLRTTITPLAGSSAPVTLAFAVSTAPELVLGSLEIPLEPPPPVVEAPPAVTPTGYDYALHEALGLFAMPSWVGLRDEQRTGIGATLGFTIASARLGEPDARLRFVAGATAGLFDDYLRISATAPLDVLGQAARSADRGARDVYFSLGSRVVRAADTGGLGLALELGMWAPTAGQSGLDRGRMMFAVDFSYRFAERFALRTRQAGIFDLAANGSALWASAYGFDVVVAGPFMAGVEGTMTIGVEDGREWYAGGVGLGLGLDLRPVVLSLGGRYGFGDDLWPTLTGTFDVRASF